MKTINANDKLKVGDIFVNSWGYDQTNINFFQITRKTKKCIYLRAISSKIEETSFMSGLSLPNKNTFIGEEIRKRPYEYPQDSCLANNIYIIFEYGGGSLWDGKAERCSWYA